MPGDICKERGERVSPVKVAMYYPELGVPESIKLILKGDSRFIFNWFKEIEDFADWIFHHDFDLMILEPYKGEARGKRLCDFNIIGQIRNNFPNCRIIVITGLQTPSNAKESIGRALIISLDCRFRLMKS